MTERSYHHGDLRRVIIDTTLRMLKEDGGWQFTLREVARRAGVSHAAPYKHFPDKAALLSEIALIGFERLQEALLAAQVAAPDDLLAEFTAISHAYLTFGQNNPALYRLMFGGAIADTAKLHLEPRALGASRVVIDFLERGQAAGLVRKRPVQGQATACWAQLHGLTMLQLDGLLMPEKVGENAVEAALAALREGLVG
ncbi:TetR/AcrR family transcriptional regulator [Paracoccus alkanivorans]|uniref:TetR/AcrR family transcriptional regulator n=1 Tax=Paracoccus alkanivorans TaxID=2116655 RepID=A0A3M0MH99_9RHOB|nr:TetR/AcrR family transcriptional regulator [Paracoccus alkanivorans]RMC35040.1 TetR/AcrR family transcriptional regulator [Paracoccus alkanivorans]